MSKLRQRVVTIALTSAALVLTVGLGALYQERTTLMADVERLAEELDLGVAKSSELLQRIEGIEAEVAALQAQRDELSTALASVEAERDDALVTIARLEDMVRALEADLRAAEARETQAQREQVQCRPADRATAQLAVREVFLAYLSREPTARELAARTDRLLDLWLEECETGGQIDAAARFVLEFEDDYGLEMQALRRRDEMAAQREQLEGILRSMDDAIGPPGG